MFTIIIDESSTNDHRKIEVILSNFFLYLIITRMEPKAITRIYTFSVI